MQIYETLVQESKQRYPKTHDVCVRCPASSRRRARRKGFGAGSCEGAIPVPMYVVLSLIVVFK